MSSLSAARCVSVITAILIRMSCGCSRSQSLMPMTPRTSKSLMITLSMGLLREVASAIHMDDLAGNVGRSGEQEEQCRFNLGQFPPALGRHGPQDGLVLARRLVSGRQNGPERQRVHTDIWSHRHCHGLREAGKCRLADRVWKVVCTWAQRPPVSHVDDAAFTARRHLCRKGF